MNIDSGSTGLFGVPTQHQASQVILQGIPWEVTTSYGSGTSDGPQAILEASPQLDLFDIEFGEAWKKGYHLDGIDQSIRALNDELKPLAQAVIESCDENGIPDKSTADQSAKVNAGSRKVNEKVYANAIAVLKEGKIPGLIGGDHSAPYGAIHAVSDFYNGDFGVLHIDAHADLRNAYQGFTHSHASIMRNVCELEQAPKKVVQVGIRDFCKEEYDYIQTRVCRDGNQIKTFFDNDLKNSMAEGTNWRALCEKIVSELPDKVYVSFDIDGLSPDFCPNTGTPVPGGLSFDQAVYLLRTLGLSGKKIVGFDLNEVAPDPDGGEWDGNVGARILFKLCGWAVTTNKITK
jgi:agmatinase